MARRPLAALFAAVLALSAAAAFAAPEHPPAGKPGGKPEDKSKLNAGTFSAIEFRSIGPALTSGRVVDLAVAPDDKSTWYVASAYGGVWKTTNAGTTWKPIFDGQGTPSIGCVTVDAKHPLTVWVGSGENNSQRSVGWGDGVYRSDDGGRSWHNMGLKASEHIGEIAVDPNNSDNVLVAAQGPLWSGGGDRGVYRSSDGGKTWKQVLHVDDWTGAGNVKFDPLDPRIVYATTYQRHRKVWTLIDGGPGSGIWKSTDGGQTFTKLSAGLPKEDIGRVGIAVTAAEPHVVYAVVEAANGAGGFFRSGDDGANWEKMSDYGSTSPQYYNELFADPKTAGRVYAVDTWLMVTDDGGRNVRRAGEKNKHVDNHVVWIDPDDTRHMLVGCDGGLYETFDRCATWKFFGNLPITQFYKLDLDNTEPFYNVYGGTQDNFSLGGPTRTMNVNGIRNSDWFVTTGGDGFQSRVDPEDPNIVYAESQHAGVVRFDRRNGEQIDIQPQTEEGEKGSRWNWDTPIIVSPHLHTRLYIASQRVFRSDDRGDSWTAISPDLTRQIDREKLPVMGRVWSVDAVAKNASTSFYGNIVALCESPVKEGLLFAGTDDGLIQVSEDGGGHWRKLDGFPGIGEYAYVSRVVASAFDVNTVYATFERHQMGDFKPYVLKSTDLGKSWTNITGDLPANGSVYALAEDPTNRNLLYCGTEFGAFFTPDGGRKWIPLKGGLPVESVRDLAVQKREGDLVLATFGRGFYVLDDLTPLRQMASEEKLAAEATLLPVRKTPMYVPGAPLGAPGPSQQGGGFFTAENPPFGAVFTYWLRDGWKSHKDARHEREKDEEKKGEGSMYPSWDSLKTEMREEDPKIVLTVTDDRGQVVRRIEGPASGGFHRVAWDLRWSSLAPPELTPRPRSEFDDGADAPLAAPGTYHVAMAKRVDGVTTALGSPQTFVCVPVNEGTLTAKDRNELQAFELRTARLQRAALGAARALGETQQRATLLKKALGATPAASEELRANVVSLEDRLRDLAAVFYGDPVLRGHEESSPAALMDRLNQVIGGHWNATCAPTKTERHNVELVGGELSKALTSLGGLRGELEGLETKAEAAGAPWTPGRLPSFTAE
jgi:photosystem II stability/assembly factor-like uncharacterized protein